MMMIEIVRYDVNARHFVSAGCYVNLEPEWLGMKYWVNDTTLTINSIPYGYKMNQFTVNPEGTHRLLSYVHFGVTFI